MQDQPRLVDDYLTWFGLARPAFDLAPDPDFLFPSDSHAEALAAVELGILQRRGLVVLVGEVGTGKTTVIRSVLGATGEDVITGYVSSTTLEFEDLLRTFLDQLNVEYSEPSKGGLLRALGRFLEEADREDRIVVLAIDEAQNLTPTAFEELRLLLNFETPKRKLLQIVLAGQPELHDKLNLRTMRHVADRIAVHCQLQPLSEAEARDYVSYRLMRAGASRSLFEPRALKVLCRASKGGPRSLNVLCHNALLFAFGRDLPTVDKKTARLSIRDRQRTGGKPALRFGLTLLVSLATVAVATLQGLGSASPCIERGAHDSAPSSDRR